MKKEDFLSNILNFIYKIFDFLIKNPLIGNIVIYFILILFCLLVIFICILPLLIAGILHNIWPIFLYIPMIVVLLSWTNESSWRK